MQTKFLTEELLNEITLKDHRVQSILLKQKLSDYFKRINKELQRNKEIINQVVQFFAKENEELKKSVNSHKIGIFYSDILTEKKMESLLRKNKNWELTFVCYKRKARD